MFVEHACTSAQAGQPGLPSLITVPESQEPSIDAVSQNVGVTPPFDVSSAIDTTPQKYVASDQCFCIYIPIST